MTDLRSFSLTHFNLSFEIRSIFCVKRAPSSRRGQPKNKKAILVNKNIFGIENSTIAWILHLKLFFIFFVLVYSVLFGFWCFLSSIIYPSPVAFVCSVDIVRHHFFSLSREAHKFRRRTTFSDKFFVPEPVFVSVTVNEIKAWTSK